MTTTFEICAIDDSMLQTVRTTGLDVSGNPVEPVVASGGEPMRCCLRDARPGEELILFGYEPVIPASPYREIGAVFAHAKPCGGPDFAGGYPPDWFGRKQILRAYDRRGWIHPASRAHDGTDPMAAIAAVLADPDVVELHSRNVVYGCYMFTARKLA
jgi:hypothetical protein